MFKPWFHFSKFASYYVLVVGALLSLYAGREYIVWGYLAFIAVIVLGDLLLGDDISQPTYPDSKVVTWWLWLSLPITVFLWLTSLWLVSPIDLLGMGAMLKGLTGYDINLNKSETSFTQIAVAAAFIGLLVSGIGTVVAHELVHRARDKYSMTIGRWLLAFSFDASFSIEHVHGHHKNVATPIDPASAPRGRNVYQHILHSTWYGNISAWNIEKQRLSRKGISAYSWQNLCLRGYAMSGVIMLVSTALAGLQGLIMFVVTAIGAKVLLEIVNYMEHYGLVRVPGKRVEPRHSWNSNRLMSTWALFNLTRHSHHHAQGSLPFEKLRPMPDSPQMPSGYLSTIFLTLIPPLWYRIMAPRLAHWDANFASEQERALLGYTNPPVNVATQ